MLLNQVRFSDGQTFSALCQHRSKIGYVVLGVVLSCRASQLASRDLGLFRNFTVHSRLNAALSPEYSEDKSLLFHPLKYALPPSCHVPAKTLRVLGTMPLPGALPSPPKNGSTATSNTCTKQREGPTFIAVFGLKWAAPWHGRGCLLQNKTSPHPWLFPKGL